MKAILNQDVIVKLSEVHGITEIGDIPSDKKGRVGFDRLRFSGSKIVDLMDLKYIWVKHLGDNSFELHAVKVPGSRRKRMSYSDRARLTFENGTIRIRTLEEVEQAKKEYELQLVKNRLRSRFDSQIGDQKDQIATIAKLVHLLILSLYGHDESAGDLLSQLCSDLKETYSMDKMQARLPDIVAITKSLMNDYYKEIDSVKGNN